MDSPNQNCENIPLDSRLKANTGLTFGQILALIGLVGSLITVYTSLNVRVSNLELNSQLNSKRIDAVEIKMETIRTENRQDHTELSNKIDELLRLEEKK